MEKTDQLHAPTALPSEKGLQVPTGKEAGWTPEPVWMWWQRGETRMTQNNFKYLTAPPEGKA